MTYERLPGFAAALIRAGKPIERFRYDGTLGSLLKGIASVGGTTGDSVCYYTGIQWNEAKFKAGVPDIAALIPRPDLPLVHVNMEDLKS